MEEGMEMGMGEGEGAESSTTAAGGVLVVYLKYYRDLFVPLYGVLVTFPPRKGEYHRV